MTLDLSKVGLETEELFHSYDWRDTARYALGVGAKSSDLEFLYEGRGPKVLPGYASVPGTDVYNVLSERIGGNKEGVVHGSQKILFHQPFAPKGTLRTVGKVEGMYDLKRLAVVHISSKTWDAHNTLLFETLWALIYRFDGGFGGKPPPREGRVKAPERAPDFSVEEPTTREQALLYRLNGDFNPLHADPELAAKVGFDRPILHGLCTFGFVDRVVVREVCGGDPSRVRQLQGQFRSPVLPGDTLVIEGWKEDTTVILKVSTKERPSDAVLANASAEITG